MTPSPPGAWHDRLYTRLVGHAVPLLIMPDAIWTAASLWAGSRQWVNQFRTAGLQSGDRIVCALPPGAAFVQVLIASLWEGLSLAVAPVRDGDGPGAAALLDALDARLLVRETAPSIQSNSAQTIRHNTDSDHANNDLAISDHTCVPGAAGWPEEAMPALRDAREARSPDVRLLLRTTGTAGDARWVALSDANVLAVIDSHAPKLELTHACVLSVLPWHHAFGLVLGLLTALLHADEIVRDDTDGRDIDALLDLAMLHPVTHMDLVPLLATRLLDDARGATLLRRLHGGIVGGAPVSSSLCVALQATRMRVGYGQTEASPGVLLGDAGEWSERLLGRAVGCDVRVDADGVLAFRGANACVGVWAGGQLVREAPDRWVRTGDVVAEVTGDAFRLVGRASDSFKLSNGRMVDATRLEDHLRRTLPDVAELLLRPSGDDALELLVTMELAPDIAQVRALLGSLGARLARVTVVASAEWRRTPKGDVVRRAPLRDAE